MAPNRRVLLVTCFTLCLFASVYSSAPLERVEDVRQENEAGNVEMDRHLRRRDINQGGLGGLQQADDGAGGGVARNDIHVGAGPPGQQFPPQQDGKLNAYPNLRQRPGHLDLRQQDKLYPKQGQYQQQQQQLQPQQQQQWRAPDTHGLEQAVQKQKLSVFQQVNKKGGASRRPIRIADHPACKDDVVALCGKNSRGNNFSVLDCLQNAGEDGSELSSECNEFLWSYKMNLTMDVRFDSAAFEVCKNEIKKFPNCAGIEKGHSLLLPCLYEVAENITNVQCRQYINRMKAITFSDFMLIKGFYDECRADIEQKGCGSVRDGPAGQNTLPHKQGATINCLEKEVEELGEGCKKQILRVAELTADEYHTDRALYFACRGDRERFCEHEAAGQGVIYNCLLKHKFKEDMSEDCRNKLTTRQKVISVDYKANYRLMRKCREDMKKTKCNKPKDPQGREFRLSALLMCLEDAKRNDVKVSGDCVAELEDTRKSLMDDFMVNPEIVTNCKDEISTKCFGLQRGGKTLNCLMKLPQEIEFSLNDNCRNALQHLVKTADAGANYRINSILQKTCEAARTKLCKDEEAGDAKVLSCLIENIYSPDMSKECETQLLVLQYFVSRDFKLDPLLFKNCKKDANVFCYVEVIDNTELPQGLVFSCLYSHLHGELSDVQPLSAGCQAQVHRVLRQRAVSVHLNPQLEAQCHYDLGRFCTEQTAKGKELACLQDNNDKLTPECQDKIGGFTQEEAEDIKMNRLLMTACAPMLKQFCKDFLSKKVDEGEALQCLIEHKNDEDMSDKCRAGIEHVQLIQLQDYRFNFKFKEACRNDVIKMCKGSKDKTSVIKCLSTKVREDTLKSQEHSVSVECRKQLKVELLQRSENIGLDQELFKGCKSDIYLHCNKVKPGNARITECLREHRKKLSEACHMKLFNRQKEQAQMVKTDYALMHTCKNMIKYFCPEMDHENLSKCLKSRKNDPAFDSKCKEVLTKRGIEEKEDFRLNPMMQKACRRDMPKFCTDIIEKSKQYEFKNKDLGGLMLQCLKKMFSAKALSPDCENYIRDAIQEAAMDYRMDPILSRLCKETTKRLCSEELETPGQGEVEECLKSKLHKGLITDIKCRMQVIRLIQESRADVHVDPLLYKSCALDIKHFCAGIPQGEGRQMSCLLEALEDTTIKLHADCRRMISERKEMWAYAVKVAPPGSLQDSAVLVHTSEARDYFLTYCMVIILVGLFFFGGLCCGRSTKRCKALAQKQVIDDDYCRSAKQSEPM